MKITEIEKGDWQVVRFCCTSGMCITCRAVANGTKRKRVVQVNKLSENSARYVAANWSSYEAVAERMPTGEK